MRLPNTHIYSPHLADYKVCGRFWQQIIWATDVWATLWLMGSMLGLGLGSVVETSVTEMICHPNV